MISSLQNLCTPSRNKGSPSASQVSDPSEIMEHVTWTSYCNDYIHSSEATSTPELLNTKIAHIEFSYHLWVTILTWSRFLGRPHNTLGFSVILRFLWVPWATEALEACSQNQHHGWHLPCTWNHGESFGPCLIWSTPSKYSAVKPRLPINH